MALTAAPRPPVSGGEVPVYDRTEAVVFLPKGSSCPLRVERQELSLHEGPSRCPSLQMKYGFVLFWTFHGFRRPVM